eukprot:jgi/Tetstr1/460381/TSEL_000059.t1
MPGCKRVMLKPANTPLRKKLRPEGISMPINGLARRDRIPAPLLDQLFCNKHGCTFRVHPPADPGSQFGYDVADLLERTTPDAAEWDGNKTELAGCGFTVTDDEATGESMVVTYFTCNTPVEYRASHTTANGLKPPAELLDTLPCAERPPPPRNGHPCVSSSIEVAGWRWDNEDTDPADRELAMKVIYDDGDSEELTESEIQPICLTTEQLSDFTRRLPQGAIDTLPAELRELMDADSDADSDAEGIVAGVNIVEGNPSDDSRSNSDGEGDTGARYDFSTWTSSARGKYDDGKSNRRGQSLYTGADATLMEAALNLCEWKLKHNTKTAAFERLSKLLKKHICHRRTAHALLLRIVKEFWEYVGTLKDMRPKMRKMDRRMALVALTSDFGRPVRPMLPSAAGTISGVVCANWTCEDFLHFAKTVAVSVFGDMFEHQHLAVMWHMLQGEVIHCLRGCEECDAPADSEECRRVNEYIKKQREEGFNCVLTHAQMCSMHLPDDMMKLNLHSMVCRVRAQVAAGGSTARDSERWMERTMRDVKCVARGSGTTDTERAYGWHFLLEARIKFLRACMDQDFPSLPLWRPGFVGQWEAAGADDAVDMFEGTGPGCMGGAVQAGTSGASATWTDCEVVHEKPETRRHVVFKHKTWDEQWVPTDEYGKQAIL